MPISSDKVFTFVSLAGLTEVDGWQEQGMSIEIEFPYFLKFLEFLIRHWGPSPHVAIVQGFIFVNSLQSLVNVNRSFSFSNKKFNHYHLFHTDF